jgi:hypothetical protein
MKDALGHGSNERGIASHSLAIDKLPAKMGRRHFEQIAETLRSQAVTDPAGHDARVNGKWLIISRRSNPGVRRDLFVKASQPGTSYKNKSTRAVTRRRPPRNSSASREHKAMKDAKGHGSSGRGKNFKPLPGHAYHKMTNDQLRYIAKDASEAGRNAQGMGDERGVNKYADQVNDASSVLGYRSRTGAGPDNADAAAALGQGHPKSEGVGAHSAMAGSRDYDAFGRPRDSLSKGEYDEYSRDLSLRSRNGGIGSGGR